MNKAFMNSTNRTGARGWYLTILPNGQLIGNGARELTSEWVLINVRTDTQPELIIQQQQPQQVVPQATASPHSHHHHPQQQQQQSAVPTSFPGLGAGREELMRFFGTPAGIEFLNQPEYRPALELYQRNGILSRILHR